MRLKGPTPPRQTLWRAASARPPAAAQQAGSPEQPYGLPIFQLAGERDWMVVTGRRTDDDDRCDLLLTVDAGGSVAFYPHGADQFGVRLSRAEALRVARKIIEHAE